MLAENRSTPRSDEELQKLTVGELKTHNAPITIVEYDPSWPDLFEREANRIRSVLGTKALQIEHDMTRCNRNCVSSDDLHSKFCQIPELSVKAVTLTLAQPGI